MYGLILYITNSKAFIVWSLILLFGMGASTDIKIQSYFILEICFLIGFVILVIYSFLFSSKKLLNYYKKNSKYKIIELLQKEQ